jgi:hypothetical protein
MFGSNDFTPVEVATISPLSANSASGAASLSLATEYNDVFMGSISSRSTIQFSVDSTYSTSVTNENIFISKSVIVNGTEGTYGLTERNNNAIFGSMPESEYASENNIYHQKKF